MVPCVPPASDEVENVAVVTPAVVESVPVPNVVVLSLKVTVPVGVPDPGEVTITVAVNVTDCPKIVGLAEETTLVVVSALLTTWDRDAEVLVLKLVSPPYTAVMECVAIVNEEAAKVAVVTPPVVERVPEPRVFAPSLKVTVPVGVPAADATVAVSVTDWLNTDGLLEEATVIVGVPLLTVWLTPVDVLVL
jgi:hypothetical protein